MDAPAGRQHMLGGQAFSASMKSATAMSRPAPKRGLRRSNSFEIGAPASGPSSLQADQQDKGDDVMGSLHALAIMKKGLCRRFSNIYEAFAFFDMKGNWRITATELELMLQKLAIGLPDVAQAMQFLDGRSKDGVIDAKEFVHMLAWHPVHADMVHQLELAKLRREVWMQSFVAVCRVTCFNPDVASHAGHCSKSCSSGRSGGRVQNLGSDRASQPCLFGPNLIWTSAVRPSMVRTTLTECDWQQKRDDVTKTTRSRRGFSGSPASMMQRSTSAGLVVARTDSAQSLQSCASSMEPSGSGKGPPGIIGESGGATDLRDRTASGADHQKQFPAPLQGQQHLSTQIRDFQPELQASRRASHRRLPAPSAPSHVDFSWRRPSIRRKLSDSDAATPPVLAAGASSNPSPADVSQQAQRKRLFQLFNKYDQDHSGTLDAAEVSSLLSDMGHKYEEEQVRQALDLIVPPEQVDSAIHLQDFCEWWECLNWFHHLGIHEGALSMASAKYKKSEWLEDMKDMRADMQGLQVKMQGLQLDNMRSNRWYETRYPDEVAGEIECPGTFRSSHVSMETANHFFEFVQREMAGRTKSQGSMLSKRRNTASDLLAAANARNQAKRTPEKYLRP